MKTAPETRVRNGLGQDEARQSRRDATEAGSDTTEDAFLDGRIVLSQPRRGHRAGLEAVLIAAATPLQTGETVLDIGAGVGTAGLCAMARVPGATAILVEAEPGLAALATHNVARNRLDDRARVVVCDVAVRGAAARAGLTGAAHHALANPPFYAPARSRISADKRPAHAAPAETLEAWMRFAAAVLQPRGTLTLVHRPEALGAVIGACANRFGDLRVLPLHPRPGHAAHRIIVQGTKGSRAPLCLLPGFVLHGVQGRTFRPEAEAVLRGGAGLSLAGPSPLPHLTGAGERYG